MLILVRILLNGLGLWAAAHLLPGIHASGDLWQLLLAGFVLGVLNVLVKPLLTLLSLPLVLVTFGLFFVVINGLVLWFADGLLDSLTIDSFLWAIAGGLFMAVWNMILRALFEKD